MTLVRAPRAPRAPRAARVPAATGTGGAAHAAPKPRRAATPKAAARPAGSTTAAAPGAAADDARARLLGAGLRLFAQQGYSKTSTRELADAASVNIGAISYYFGDKAGLYRAVFFEPMGEAQDEIARFAAPGLPLPQALAGFFEVFLEPLRRGDEARLCMKLRFREMLEPTGLWDEEIMRGIKPMHDAMTQLLARHLGLKRADLELRRLVVSLAGLGVHVHVGRDITDQIAPGLNAGPRSIDTWVRRLSEYALAMVGAEAQRRGLKLATKVGVTA